jgi:DNA-binding CsgD family transcriptional regulator
VLLGRVNEMAALDQVLATARGGAAGVIVLRGPAGIGKTALLDWVTGRAGDTQVTRVVGVESEMDLGFAGLHQVVMPFLDGLERLPPPQYAALSAAFGRVSEAAPDRFLVGLAALTLVTEAAVKQPVLCVVDDAQWLDRVSLAVLGFVARRLQADPVGMIFAVRDGEQRTGSLDGLADLAVGPLADDAAMELLTATARFPVDRRVGSQIVTQAAGNALALVEFGGAITAAEAAGSAPLAEPLRFSGRLDELYRSRVHAMPPASQQLLLVVAADQTGQPDRVWEAAGKLGIDPDLAWLPSIDQLVSFGQVIRFRHPLMRSAVYHAASAAARRRVHEALAAVCDPVRDPDRRAWHLAEATLRPDEQVAAELERSAERARGRGGWASGAVFLERSADLTPDEPGRARRLLGAAEARFVAGEAPAVLDLVERAAGRLEDPVILAQARQLEGLSVYAAGDVAQATAILLDAAAKTGREDPRRARDILLDALVTAQFTGSAATARVLGMVAELPLPHGDIPTLTDLLLDGFAALGEGRHADGAELLRLAVGPLSSGRALPDDVLRYFLPVSMAASVMFDDSAWHELEHRWVAELRSRGALSVMLVALVSVAYNQMEEGRFADAEVTIAEGRALSEATGFRAHLGLFACAELIVLARRGRESAARALAERLLPQFTRQGYGLGAYWGRSALCQLELGLGNYGEALRIVLEGTPRAGSAVDLIEAGCRSGDIAAATAALDSLAPIAAAAGTPAGLGWLALGRAMLADSATSASGTGDNAVGGTAEAQYQLAIDHLERSRHVPMLARARLLYGEWLRRHRRRRDARDQLNIAYETFTRLDMAAFAERARVELRAVGELTRSRTVASTDDLTPQELQIARLASEGASNAEIAARLFISASTVEYHLRKVFRKLGITTRVRIGQALRGRYEMPATGPQPGSPRGPAQAGLDKDPGARR